MAATLSKIAQQKCSEQGGSGLICKLSQEAKKCQRNPIKQFIKSANRSMNVESGPTVLGRERAGQSDGHINDVGIFLSDNH